MVWFMSGAFGIVQTLILMYSKDPNPVWQEKVFWSFVWIAFVVSSFIVWIIEHRKVRELERRIDGNRPLLAGYIRKVVAQPRWSKADPEGERMILETRIHLHLGLTNCNKTETTVLNFGLIINDAGKTYPLMVSRSEPVSADADRTDHHKDLTKYLKDDAISLTQGKHFEGWLTFYMPEAIGIGGNTIYTVIITDSFLGEHRIQKKDNPKQHPPYEDGEFDGTLLPPFNVP